MDLRALIDRFRAEIGDDAVPIGGSSGSSYLFSDEKVTAFLNEAENEACERALLIEDNTTPAVCSISLVAGQSDYPLHASVIKVERVSFRGGRLSPSSVELEDQWETFWENRSGLPRRFIVGPDASNLRVVPKPVEVGTLALTVYRLPLAPLTIDEDSVSPEIKPIYHPRLLPWAYRCAYLTRDSEVYDVSRAAQEEARFEASFGRRPDANVQRKHRDQRPHVVKMRW